MNGSRASNTAFIRWVQPDQEYGDSAHVQSSSRCSGYAQTRHIERSLKVSQRLPVLISQAVEKRAPGRIVKGFEDRIHGNRL